MERGPSKTYPLRRSRRGGLPIRPSVGTAAAYSLACDRHELRGECGLSRQRGRRSAPVWPLCALETGGAARTHRGANERCCLRGIAVRLRRAACNRFGGRTLHPSSEHWLLRHSGRLPQQRNVPGSLLVLRRCGCASGLPSRVRLARVSCIPPLESASATQIGLDSQPVATPAFDAYRSFAPGRTVASSSTTAAAEQAAPNQNGAGGAMALQRMPAITDAGRTMAP